MTATEYRRLVLDTLQGRTAGLGEVPPERLDWDGPGAVLTLYGKTSGDDRTRLIRAIGKIIHDHKAPAAVVAQLVDIASGLDLAQIEPDVRYLAQQPIARQEPIRSAVANYLAYRELALRQMPAALPPRGQQAG